MMKTEMTLQGLGCASCAAKMETEIQSLAGVNGASVNFIAQKLQLEAEETADLTLLYRQIEGIVRRIEPDVEVLIDGHPAGVSDAHSREHPHDESRTHTQNPSNPRGRNISHWLTREMVRLIAGGAVFALGLFLNTAPPLELAVFLTAYVIVGGPVVIRAFQNLVRGQLFDENFLMTVATLGAFLIGEYPEGVAVMLFYLVGEMFQDRAVDHSRRSISALMDIRPDYANLKIADSLNGDLKKVSPEDVSIGDLIVVKPGEKVPLDGMVREGTSLVDTAALTGESMPRELAPGSAALSGFINRQGLLTIEVTKNFGDSTVSKILELVQHAASRKAPTEQFITKFARIYTPAVVFSALAIAVIPPMALPGADFSQWIYRALIFLVISCPCALVISIPLGFFGGIGGASKRGILVKGSNYLEALNSVETVVFDKTGTLTRGIFEVTAINPQPGFSRESLLENTAYAESYSSHPIAVSVLKAYGQEIDRNRITSYEEVAGHGTRVTVDGREVLAGNTRLMEQEKIAVVSGNTPDTCVHVAVDGRYGGCLLIADQVKEDAAEAIRSLKSLGIRNTIMLTGDTKEVGEAIGYQLGLDEIYTELLPADKVEILERIDAQKSPRKKVAVVGDGINDAPVLARADIGIAMGGLGSDAAIEAADIVIMTDEPAKIATAIKVARRTRQIVYQNIVFALGVKGIFLVLGAFGVATMWEAVFADVGVAVIAILNATRVMNTSSLS
ncbi:MAG: heavy metal translocating P-type ATPase [Bacillota bacterium]|nr:heavy metal translocating P-type ATPase [Bacillota bacterium]MDW7677387.1 heavy metal translocating P-type ATPase [Bacillota bacterium]